MNKQRTRKAATKRFKVTKNGKILHRSNGIRHLRTNKSKKQLRSLKTIKELTGIPAKKVKKMLGIA